MISEEQRIRRQNGIFSTDVVKIMTGSAVEVACEKLGLHESKNISDLWNVKLGNVMEPHILKAYERMKGVKLIHSPDTIYHPHYPWFGVHLDGLDEANNEVVEAKAFNRFLMKKFGEENTDDIPVQRLWQSLVQISITGCKKVYIPIFTVTEQSLAEFICDGFISDDSLSFYEVNNDDEAQYVISEVMLPRLCKVRECIEANDLDALVTMDDESDKLSNSAQFVYKQSVNNCIEVNNNIAANIEQLKTIKNEESSLKIVKDGLLESIKRYMKSNENLVSSENNLIATWKTYKDGSRRFSLK